MKGLRFYFPGGRTADTLAEALDFGESFVVATDDHETVYFVDWAEYDDDDRAELRALLDLTEAEQARRLVEDVAELDDDDRRRCRDDDLRTLLSWSVEP